MRIPIIIYRLSINIKIWESTPNSLIDFEADHNKNLSTIVKNQGTLYQIGDTLKLFSSKEEFKKKIENYQNNQKFLCNVVLHRDLYDIEMTEEEQRDILSVNNNDLFNNNNFDIDNIPWIISKYVFENSQEHGYKLHKGDIFKLGKYILRVRELGIDDDKKHFFFENKNTQKYMRNRSINNISQIPLNQQGENYFSALNLNQIINEERKEENNNDNNNDNGRNIKDNSNNNNANENGSNHSHGSNIQIIKNESHKDEGNNDNNSNYKENKNLNNNDNENNNFGSIIQVKHCNNENQNKDNGNNENNNNGNPVVSIYYSNNPSSRKNNNSQSPYNEIISYKGSSSNKNNGNIFLINIIKNNSLQNNNNILDDSKNKININNSINMNSLGFNTFHNNSIINSSINLSGKNISNLNNSNNDLDQDNSKKNINLNLNINNINKNQFLKNSFNALKSTASFKKNKLTEIIQKKILQNSASCTEKNNNKPICRICLSEEYDEINPLIHPCNCDGTMKYIHLQCLKLLIQSKIKKTETESCKVFTFKTLECEICKMVFPEKIRIKNSIFSIIDFEKPDKDYIILDGLIKETPEEKSIFIVHFKNKKEIKIGRATDANIRLSDISVSRAHAIITQYNESFFLHDTNSKFGTLISIGNKFCILYNKPFSVQKGNILFEFLMKKSLCATLRCYRPSVILYKTYNDFLDETFAYKYQTKDEELLIPEKTKTVSEYSSDVIIKPNNQKNKSSKNIHLFENNENNNDSDFNINKKKNNSNSMQSKEDNKNSANNSNENNKSNNNSNEKDENININQQNFFDSFKIDKKKDNINNNVGELPSFGVNKTQEISNTIQINEENKSNSKIGISLYNNGNENSLLVNNVSNDKI